MEAMLSTWPNQAAPLERRDRALFPIEDRWRGVGEQRTLGLLDMNMRSFTKAQRREIRRLAGLAHERELDTAAGQLQSEFDRWRRREIDVFVLNDHIHKFHDGTSRDLYKRYAMGEAEWSVASAIAREVLKESEIDRSILEALRSVIELARQMGQEDEEA
jgi:hypothetical protein